MLLAERERWAEGRYLAVDLQLVCERNDDQARRRDRPRAGLPRADVAGARRRRQRSGGPTCSRSVKHTVGVSKDLREGVRQSIEIIANEVVRAAAPRGLPTAARDRGAAAGPPVAALPLPDPVPALRRGVARAGRAAGRAPPSTTQGYSLDRLRELSLVDAGHAASPQRGTHLYESLGVLFRLVDEATRRDARPTAATTRRRHDGPGASSAARRPVPARGHRAASTRSAWATRALQQVLRAPAAEQGAARPGPRLHLLRPARHQPARRGLRGPDVLHRLLRRRPTCTRSPRTATPSKGSWVVPVDRADGIAAERLRRDRRPGDRRAAARCCTAGHVRLPAGRPGAAAVASYYTPEVLTRFVVGQALEELLDQDGTTTTAARDPRADDLRAGAGVRRVPHRGGPPARRRSTCTRRQEELGAAHRPGRVPAELQKVKAYLALHNVYGVDLNATAVELAEISLWLDTMVAGCRPLVRPAPAPRQLADRRPPRRLPPRPGRRTSPG